MGVAESVRDLEHAVFGNGTEGLKSRMLRVEIAIDGYNRIFKWLAGIMASLAIVAIISLATQWVQMTRAINELRETRDQITIEQQHE